VLGAAGSEVLIPHSCPQRWPLASVDPCEVRSSVLTEQDEAVCGPHSTANDANVEPTARHGPHSAIGVDERSAAARTQGLEHHAMMIAKAEGRQLR
jgi:hypothetical protein